jgi:hypothetical protein
MLEDILFKMMFEPAQGEAWEVRRKYTWRELELEQKYGKEYRALKKQASRMLHELENSLAKHGKLKTMVLESREKSASLKKLVDQKPNAKIIAKMLKWRVAKTDALEKALENQELLIKDQKFEFERIDEDRKMSYDQKEAAINKERRIDTYNNATKLLARYETSGSQNVIKRMENKVLEKEKKATELHEAMSSGPRQTESKEVEELTAQIESRIQQFELKIQQFESKVTSAQEMLQNMDSNTERALERLKKQHSIAIEHAEKSYLEETNIEKNVATWESHAKILKAEAKQKTRKVSQSFTENSPQKLIEIEQQLEEFIAALRSHRLRNLALQQRLFTAELIVKRLSFIHLILSVIPDKAGELILDYHAISTAVQSYLKIVPKAKGSTIDQESDLPTRLSALESKTQRALIRTVREILLEPPSEASPEVLKKLYDASVIMRAEKLLHEPYLEKWKKLAKQSDEEKKELLNAVAVDREKRYTEILEIIEQSNKVIFLSYKCLRRNRKLE